MFYTFLQNNTHGRWVYDAERGLAPFVIVEATDGYDAMERAVAIGIYFDGCSTGVDCRCCGDRWHDPYDAAEVPAIDGEPAADYVPQFAPVEHLAFIHRMDGSKEAILPVAR